MTKYSWKDVFYPHKHYGWVSICADAARAANYKYLCWNGMLYKVNYGFGPALDVIGVEEDVE